MRARIALPFPSFSTLAVVCLATAILLGTSTTVQAADPEPKRVLMLHSFGPRFKPWSDYEQTIRSEISRHWQKPVDFLDHSLVNARQDDENSEAAFVEYLRALYTSRPVDLIVAIGAPAAAFVQRYRQRLFPTTPMVFTAVEQRRVQYEKLTENDTVVAVAHDFPAAFENILRVLPLTKTIAVVNGTSPNETFWQDEMRRELAPLAGRVELRWYNEKSFEEILIDAARLPPHSAIFWHLMNVDAAGVAHEANDALNKLSSSANAPIFSYDGSFFGEAIVGGPMHSVQKLGQITAAVAVRILNGEKAGDIKTPPTGFAAPIFDWRQMQRWGIAESSLPPGSTVYFREPTVWERYSWQIALIIAVHSDAGRAYLGPATRASSASICRSAVAAAHGRTGPCHPLLDRWRTDRLNCSRNQPAARLYSDQRRNRKGNPEISEPRHRGTERDRWTIFCGMTGAPAKSSGG